jgi:hypothetical protein
MSGDQSAEGMLSPCVPNGSVAATWQSRASYCPTSAPAVGVVVGPSASMGPTVVAPTAAAVVTRDAAIDSVASEGDGAHVCGTTSSRSP